MAHLHLLGICGTFMGGVAMLARELGHRVTGSDASVYPPMSTMLADHGIDIVQGYDPGQLEPAPDLTIIGNALSRGNVAVEAVLNRQLPYTSGPAWLGEQVLGTRHVVAIAGTHGKTTAASALAWALERCGAAPGFLVGGVPGNFDRSARLGTGACFVIEADEYDTAFFDKRSKFVHYRPRVAVINNIEFDHADIFDDLAAIRRQFHHFIRTIPGEGRIIVSGEDAEIDKTLAMGCWTPVETFAVAERPGRSHRWQAVPTRADHREFRVFRDGNPSGESCWPLIGRHNLANALAAVAAAAACGIDPADACDALRSYVPVKRRLELAGEVDDIRVLQDFAHHPTAIRATLRALKEAYPDRRTLAAVDPRSNSMKLGAHRDTLADALAEADRAFFYQSPDLRWGTDSLAKGHVSVHASVDDLLDSIFGEARPRDCIVVMSNGYFDNLAARLVQRLAGNRSAACAPGNLAC